MTFIKQLFVIHKDDPRKNQKELVSFLYYSLEMFKLLEPIPDITLLGVTFKLDLKLRTLTFSEMLNLGYEAESFDDVLVTLESLHKLLEFHMQTDEGEIIEVLNVFEKITVNKKKEEIGFRFNQEFLLFHRLGENAGIEEE